MVITGEWDRPTKAPQKGTVYSTHHDAPSKLNNRTVSIVRRDKENSSIGGPASIRQLGVVHMVQRKNWVATLSVVHVHAVKGHNGKNDSVL